MIELYDIGPNPCAREIFVAHLPKEKIGPTPVAHDATLGFSERLEKLGLQIERRRESELE